MKLYTPKEASKLLGVSVKTIRRWDKSGRIKCFRTVGGKRRVPELEIKRVLGIHEERKIVGYVRVSSHTQKDDLNRQVKIIRRYAFENGYDDVVVLRDIGSGLNEDRRSFRKLMRIVVDNMVSKVIVAYPDEIIRVAENYFKFLKAFMKFEDIISLAFTADTVNMDSSGWSP